MPSLHGQSMVFLVVVVGCSVCLFGDPCHFTVRASITSSPSYTSLKNSRVSSVRAVAEAAEDVRSLTAPLLNDGKRPQRCDVRASLHCIYKKE